MSRRVEVTAEAYDKRGRLLAVGRNSYTRTHPIQARYASRVGKPAAIFLHAEIDALIKAGGPVHRIVVTRLGEGGKPMLSKPCEVCQLALKEYGVKVVQHS